MVIVKKPMNNNDTEWFARNEWVITIMKWMVLMEWMNKVNWMNSKKWPEFIYNYQMNNDNMSWMNNNETNQWTVARVHM